MFSVYILYSEKLDRFYIGTTDNIEHRLNEHNSELKPEAFTLRGRPWTVFLVIENLESKQAYLIEQHIKQMKSSTYIKNLHKYLEMVSKLIKLYP